MKAFKHELFNRNRPQFIKKHLAKPLALFDLLFPEFVKFEVFRIRNGSIFDGLLDPDPYSDYRS